jgi:hypothetical protein
MIGMLIGIAALSAWGLYRFNQILAGLPSAGGHNLLERLAAQAARVRTAYVMQYGDIFTITAIVCVAGAVFGLLIAGRHEHADEPAPTTDADDPAGTLIDEPTRAFDAPTQTISSRPPDQTVRIQQQPPPGRHRPR